MSAYSHNNSNRFHFTNPNFPFFILLSTIEMTTKCLKLKWRVVISLQSVLQVHKNKKTNCTTITSFPWSVLLLTIAFDQTLWEISSAVIVKIYMSLCFVRNCCGRPHVHYVGNGRPWQSFEFPMKYETMMTSHKCVDITSLCHLV